MSKLYKLKPYVDYGYGDGRDHTDDNFYNDGSGSGSGAGNGDGSGYGNGDGSGYG